MIIKCHIALFSHSFYFFCFSFCCSLIYLYSYRSVIISLQAHNSLQMHIHTSTEQAREKDKYIQTRVSGLLMCGFVFHHIWIARGLHCCDSERGRERERETNELNTHLIKCCATFLSAACCCFIFLLPDNLTVLFSITDK